MPELDPSPSLPTPGSGPVDQDQNQPQGQSDTNNPPHIQPVLTAQHLDHVSNYHDGQHDSKERDGDIETEYSELEQVRNQDYDEAAREGVDEVPEVRMGILDKRDLEGSLEKKQSARSIKDPNLVRATDSNLCKMTV